MPRKPGTPKTGGRDFQPGQSGNPNGRKPLPPDLKGIKKITTDELQRQIAKFAGMTKQEISDHLRDPEATMLDIMIGTVMVKAAKDGDHSRFNFLLDRTIGRVKESLEVTVPQPYVIRRPSTGEEVVLGSQIAGELDDGDNSGSRE